MSKIDIRNWDDYKIGDLFDIHPTKNYKMNNAYLFEKEGSTPVVVNSSFNNGVGGYVDLEPTEKGGIITFSDTTSATAIFYQHEDFIGYSHVQGMYPKDTGWSEKSLLFFLTIFKKTAFLLGFDYVNKFTRDIAKEIKVKLPSKFGKPDYEKMENIINQYLIDSEKHIKNLSEINSYKPEKINIENWKNFKVGDIFPCVISPKVYHVKDVVESEDGIPYVVRTKYNNGVKYKVKKKKEYILNPAGTISFGAENTTFFYQPEEYISGRDMYYIDTRNLSTECALFVVAILQKITEKYSYNYGLFPNLLKEEIIKLPSTFEGVPDWNYMEKCIKKFKITGI